MNEQRLEHIEDMLSQLTKMVGSMQAEQQDMKRDIHGLKSGQQDMKRDIHGLKSDQQDMKSVQQDMKTTQKEMQDQIQQLEAKAEERHQEILARFKDLEIDQDEIWEKATRNEREIEHLKRKLG